MTPGDGTGDRPGVLISSNFANDIGYAWTFIFRLQSVVARALHERGVDVWLSFAEIRGPVTTLGAGVPFRAFEFDPLHVSLKSAVRLFGLVRRHRIRFAYLTDMPTWHWLYGVMRLAGVRRIVCHSHVSVPDPDPVPEVRGVKRWVKALVHRTPLASDTVYAVSGFVAQRLSAQACYPVERTYVIRNGIDLEAFACPDRERSPGPLRVFLGARATKFKGVHTLIEATRLLAQRPDLPPFVVRYAGDGPDAEAFRAQAREAGLDGRFQFLGKLASTVSEICAADIVVVPSIWGDAAPLAAIEGLAAGKPVVAAKAGGLPEIVGGPDSGILVPAGDAPALADALASLLTDDRRRSTIAANARRRAHELYDQEASHRVLADRVKADFGLESVDAA